MSKTRLILFYWVPAFIWMAFIFSLSNRQRINFADTYAQNFAIFKTLHVIEYVTLYLLLFRAYFQTFTKKMADNKIFLLAVGTAILYSVSDEFHQTFVPTREGAIRDVFIDTIGILIAFSYTKTYLSKLRKYI